MRTRTANHARFWRRHPGLVWSAKNASDSVFLRAALLRPRFERLLDVAVEFGLERLRAEWKILADEGAPESRRAGAAVERILRNIAKGFALAETTTRPQRRLKEYSPPVPPTRTARPSATRCARQSAGRGNG